MVVIISVMYGSSSDWGRFKKNFRFYTICNIKGSQELQRFNRAYGFISAFAVVTYNHHKI